MLMRMTARVPRIGNCSHDHRGKRIVQLVRIGVFQSRLVISLENKRNIVNNRFALHVILLIVGIIP